VAEEALRNAPNSLDARLALIRAWIARGDRQRAAEALTALKQQAPAVADLQALDGSLQLALGNTAAARASFAEALRLNGGLFEALAGLTTIDVLQGRTSAARARLEAALSPRPEDADLLFLMAKVHIADHNLAGAEDALRHAIDVDPLNSEAYSLLARVYSDQHKMELARTELDDLARREPKNIAPRLMSAILLHAAGNLGEAKRRYADVLQMEPHAALAANNLASIYADERENLDLAEELAESALDQLPAHAGVQDTVGWVYYQRNRFGDAGGRFEKSIALDPANPLYHYHLGLAYSKNGEPERARQALQTALKLNPRYGDAQQLLESLKD
jgi:tetratricopeptide (TPR) repeat protein